MTSEIFSTFTSLTDKQLRLNPLSLRQKFFHFRSKEGKRLLIQVISSSLFFFFSIVANRTAINRATLHFLEQGASTRRS